MKRGKRPANGKIKVVPRALTCFVGRLEHSTTEQELRDYLNEVGILDVTCRKLEAKDGRIFKSAAFRVSCSEEYRDLFYDEANWPEGADLRDWVFYNNNGSTK